MKLNLKAAQASSSLAQRLCLHISLILAPITPNLQTNSSTESNLRHRKFASATFTMKSKRNFIRSTWTWISSQLTTDRCMNNLTPSLPPLGHVIIVKEASLTKSVMTDVGGKPLENQK